MYKQCKSPLAAAAEGEILRGLRARGAAVPAVLDCREGVLVMEYLPGEALPDVIERGAYEPEALAGALCAWFAGFYAAVQTVPAGTAGESRGDVNGRNFLYHDGKVYGVDFEGRCTGSRARDAGRLAAFLATYDTCDTAKRDALAEAFMEEFAESFGCGMEEILAEREMEYGAMRRRRG